MNKTIKIIIAIVITASIGFNVYTGLLKLEQKGFNRALNAVISSIQQNGFVRIGDLILVPKNEIEK